VVNCAKVNRRDEELRRSQDSARRATASHNPGSESPRALLRRGAATRAWPASSAEMPVLRSECAAA
jgi:hypothetical protein